MASEAILECLILQIFLGGACPQTLPPTFFTLNLRQWPYQSKITDTLVRLHCARVYTRACLLAAIYRKFQNERISSATNSGDD